MKDRVKIFIVRLRDNRVIQAILRLIDHYATRVWMLIISIVLTIALFSLADQAKRTERLAEENKEIAQRVANGLRDQREERARNIYINCLGVNRRHDDTIEILDTFYNEVPDNRRIEVERSYRFTKLILSAAVPRRDCRAEVVRQVDRVRIDLTP